MMSLALTGAILRDLSLAGHARAVEVLDRQSGEARMLCGGATKLCRASGGRCVIAHDDARRLPRGLDWNRMRAQASPSGTMLFRLRVPQPPLDAFVESIWVYRNDPYPHALERVLPTGAAQLIVNLNEDQLRIYNPDRPHECITTPGTVLSGARSSCQVIDTAEQEYVAGVVFRPGGSAAFMRVPAHETSETDTPLDLLWGRQQASRSPQAATRDGSIGCAARRIETALRAG